MKKNTKRIEKLQKNLDTEKLYSLKEAVSLIKANTSVKFDETLDVAINLGIDATKSDQLVRGVVQLPHGNGKSVKIAVFATGAKAQEAKDAGADIVGSDDLVAAIEKGEINFDKCIATPDMMLLLGKVAKILGPKGLMPNAKLGSVTVNIKDAVASAKAGQVEFRAEKGGIVHCGVGKLSFTENALVENLTALFDALAKAKPATSKGVYFRRMSLSSTMGVGLKLDLSSIVKNI